MTRDLHEVAVATAGTPIAAEPVRIIESRTAVGAEFRLSSVAGLTPGDQFFTTAFDRGHGSIDMTNIVLK